MNTVGVLVHVHIDGLPDVIESRMARICVELSAMTSPLVS